MSDQKKRGPKSAFEAVLGNGVFKNPRYPEPIWELLGKKETKITLQEMALNKNFERKIHQLGAEQKAKRLNEKTPPE
jgi:hypothetical protein